jgi:DNA repair protein RadA/Sms
MTRNGPPPPAFRCQECEAPHARWVGRCTGCGAWAAVAAADSRSDVAGGPPQPIAAVQPASAPVLQTGLGELDRVLGSGLVPGSVTLVAGEPGVGKSTLLLEAAARTARAGHRVLLVTAEESAAQVRARAERIAALADHLYLVAQTDLARILDDAHRVAPQLLVVDSVQTVAAGSVEGAPGGVAQVREVTAALTRQARAAGRATLLVGHVTKDGSVAGPRTLEHLVDVVLSVDGDPQASLRVVRASKNRFGATDEVGCFELTAGGVLELPDPSGLFLSHSPLAAPGTCVTVSLQGRRSMLAEIQALVGGPAGGTARRASTGLDPTRLAVVLAVTERRGGVQLGQRDVFLATVGGARVVEPAADLAVALATASAACGRPIPRDTVAVGELGLSGELRGVPGLDRRLSEAARLGFRRALVPLGVAAPAGLRALPVPDLATAIDAVSAPPGVPAGPAASSPDRDRLAVAK